MKPGDKIVYLNKYKATFIDYVKHHGNYKGQRKALIVRDDKPQSILRVLLTKIKKVDSYENQENEKGNPNLQGRI